MVTVLRSTASRLAYWAGVSPPSAALESARRSHLHGLGPAPEGLANFQEPDGVIP